MLFKNTLARIRGAHGLVVLSTKEPEKIIAARIGNAGGVVIGLGKVKILLLQIFPQFLNIPMK